MTNLVAHAQRHSRDCVLLEGAIVGAQGGWSWSGSGSLMLPFGHVSHVPKRQHQAPGNLAFACSWGKSVVECCTQKHSHAFLSVHADDRHPNRPCSFKGIGSLPSAAAVLSRADKRPLLPKSFSFRRREWALKCSPGCEGRASFRFRLDLSRQATMSLVSPPRAHTERIHPCYGLRSLA